MQPKFKVDGDGDTRPRRSQHPHPPASCDARGSALKTRRAFQSHLVVEVFQCGGSKPIVFVGYPMTLWLQKADALKNWFSGYGHSGPRDHDFYVITSTFQGFYAPVIHPTPKLARHPGKGTAALPVTQRTEARPGLGSMLDRLLRSASVEDMCTLDEGSRGVRWWRLSARRALVAVIQQDPPLAPPETHGEADLERGDVMPEKRRYVQHLPLPELALHHEWYDLLEEGVSLQVRIGGVDLAGVAHEACPRVDPRRKRTMDEEDLGRDKQRQDRRGRGRGGAIKEGRACKGETGEAYRKRPFVAIKRASCPVTPVQAPADSGQEINKSIPRNTWKLPRVGRSGRHRCSRGTQVDTEKNLGARLSGP